MIKDIQELNFPSYATLSTATATHVDMGDKTITAQVKIDGSIVPDFSYDWEIEFQGERYIQPLREPQASKGNESISSIIDLTFYHKGIYDLKRYFFVSTVELEAGTLMADNYVVPLRLNIAEFVAYLNNVLKYYYGDTYKVFLNPDYKYEETDRKDIDINYTKIWDVVTKMYEWFGVRWSWETQQDNIEYYSIKIGYPSTEVSHTFEYGFEGGILKFERQVQNAEIANVVFGRGSSENIPYRYFKNKSEDNPTFPADPDWIPELENIHFANLRGKTFRDYVKGWKSNPNRDTLDGTLEIEPIDPNLFSTSSEYARGLKDDKFNPIEYVADQESIAKYGEIQKGLEHNEEIKPTIQGITIGSIGRVDEIVDVEEILVDESTENSEQAINVQEFHEVNTTKWTSGNSNEGTPIKVRTKDIYVEKDAAILKDIVIDCVQHVDITVTYYYQESYQGDPYSRVENTYRARTPLTKSAFSYNVINADTGEEIEDISHIPQGTTFYIQMEAILYGFEKSQIFDKVIFDQTNGGMHWRERVPKSKFEILTHFHFEVDYISIHGDILGNYESGATRITKNVEVKSQGTGSVTFTTKQFTISEGVAPASIADMPYRVSSSLKGGMWDARPNVVAINVDTQEHVSPINMPAGTYYLQNTILMTNLSKNSQTFKVELLPTYIYYSYDSDSWKPTFDIWVKNIWGTMPEKGEEDYTYEHRIWDAILGNHLGDDAKVVFSSGWLSGHSDWEFLIADTPKRDTSKTIDGVPSEWRITLYKSDAEMEATSKWLPSIATHANAGDHFYFVGIEMPHQYVLWAEERLDQYKRDELYKVSNVDSDIVVQLDKVRLNQLQASETKLLIDSLRVGNDINVADSRFIQSTHKTLHLQSVTYTWDANTIMLPNIEVVLSDNVIIYPNIVKDIEHSIDITRKDIATLYATSKEQNIKAKKSLRETNNNIKTLSTGSIDITNQVNVLIGDDKWMSAREIAESVMDDSIGDSGIYIASFPYEALRQSMGTQRHILCDMLSLVDAIAMNKIIVVRKGVKSQGYDGVYVMNCYIKDNLLYFVVIDEVGDMVICNGSPITDTRYIYADKLSRKQYSYNDLADKPTILTEDDVANIIAAAVPTEVATATQRKDMRDIITPVKLLSPNVMYDWSGTSKETLTIPNLGSGDVAYDNKWMVRLSMITSDGLTIPFDVMWKDGIAPSWSEWCTCEMTFTKDGIERIMGEWKLYR